VKCLSASTRWINPADWCLRDDHKTLPPEWRPKVSFPLILGTDVSGVVEAFAEYVTVPALEVALKPTGIDHAHAAGDVVAHLIELGHNTPNPLQPRMHEPAPLEGKTVLVPRGCRRRGALERRRPRFESELARFPKSLAI
jgi:NADPH:quinone reductase-like Zn-dependent oxidoreductase